AKRRTEAIRRERMRTQARQGAAVNKTVGPTLKKAWGDRTVVIRPRSGVPKRSGRWARRKKNETVGDCLRSLSILLPVDSARLVSQAAVYPCSAGGVRPMAAKNRIRQRAP